MVEKKEGAEMTCMSCGTDLVCHEKRYPASDNFPEKVVMQWQNSDGTAHYSTVNGKDFTCNVPKEKPIAQTTNNTSPSMTNEQIISRMDLAYFEFQRVWQKVWDDMSANEDVPMQTKFDAHVISTALQIFSASWATIK